MEINPGTGGGGSGASLTVTDGVTPVVNVSTINFTSGAVVTGGAGTANVAISGSSTTFVTNEIVSGSGTTFTLANTPVSGSQAVYANGQRLTPGGGQDYTISGAVITMASSWATGTVLADYRR